MFLVIKLKPAKYFIQFHANIYSQSQVESLKTLPLAAHLCHYIIQCSFKFTIYVGNVLFYGDL